MRRWLGLLICLLVPSALLAEEKFFFQKGDKIVFLGDSITEQYQYSSDIELYLTTRFPDWNLVFINAGIGGDTANGGAGRFKAHILDEKPTCVTINFGMNDGGYGAFDKPRNDTFVKQTTAMVEMANKAKVRVALISPNAVDPRIAERFKLYLETQKQFYAPLKEIAEKHKTAYVDQYATTRSVLEKLASENAKTVIPFGDGFHTSSPGGLLMAYSILTGMNAPGLVSDVRIDVAKNEATAEKCKVTNLAVKQDTITFERSDEAIPVPVQKDWLTLLPYLKDLKDFNYYGLKMTGLTAEKYKLSIDGKEIGQFTSKELSEGVNLGNVTTGPIYDQGQKVRTAIKAKNELVHKRFNEVVKFTPPNFPAWAADLQTALNEKKAKELSTRLEVIDTKQAEIYKMVQPTTHRFEVVAVAK